MSPRIIPANVGTDTPSFSTDYKFDIDIDIHKPTDSFDTDYRPDYDGKYIFLVLNYFIFFVIFKCMDIRFI